MHNQKFNEHILIFLFADSNNSDSVKVTWKTSDMVFIFGHFSFFGGIILKIIMGAQEKYLYLISAPTLNQPNLGTSKKRILGHPHDPPSEDKSIQMCMLAPYT